MLPNLQENNTVIIAEKRMIVTLAYTTVKLQQWFPTFPTGGPRLLR